MNARNFNPPSDAQFLAILLQFDFLSADLVQEFHRWLLAQREIVKECCDRSGDTHIVERKLQKLKVKAETPFGRVHFSKDGAERAAVFVHQGAMERVEEGEAHLTHVCEEGEKLLLHLPKANAGQVQQHLSSIQQDWDSFVEQCRQNQQILEDSASLMKG